MKAKSALSSVFASCVAVACLFAVVPAASADEGTVTSTKSFPSYSQVRRNLTAEATSTSTDDNSSWGDVESLNVPQTQSQAEKEAAARKAAEEQAAAQAQASQTQAASRSAQRAAIPQVDLGSATGSGADVARVASQFSGYPYVYGGNTPSGWDCSGFVQYVYAQFGISLPHSSGAQAGVGTAVGSLAQAQPGDIVANGTHAAIYIGNGLVMNALSPGLGTQVTSTSVFSGGYSIRRVL